LAVNNLKVIVSIETHTTATGEFSQNDTLPQSKKGKDRLKTGKKSNLHMNRTLGYREGFPKSISKGDNSSESIFMI